MRADGRGMVDYKRKCSISYRTSPPTHRKVEYPWSNAPSFFQPATNHMPIYVASLFALLFVSFHNLEASSIADFDEARHAVNAYEMMRNGDYLVNTYMGETDLWNLKPPLGYWTVMVGYALFGYTSFGLRFVSAVCWLLTAFPLARWLLKRAGLPHSIRLVLLI